MEFRKISVEISIQEVNKIKQFIIGLGDIRNSVSVKKIEGAKDSSIYYYTFTIEEEVLKSFVLKFSSANLKAVSQEDINHRLRSTIKGNAAYHSAVDRNMSSDELQSIKKKKRIEDFIEEGRYSVLLDIVKDIRAEQNKRNRAEAALPATVKKAIEINFEEGCKSKRRAFTALEELVSIATNAQLKNLRLNHILENSGYKAMELCTKFDDFADELIKIANNIKMPNIVSIKSIIQFAETTLRDNRNFKFEYEADIVYATKNTNLRWLKIAYDTVEHELDEEEKKQYDMFMSFIEYKKLGN